MALEVPEPSEMPASSSSQTLYDKEAKEPTKPSKSLESTRSMSFPRIRKPSKAARAKYTLTETQKEMYAAEKLMNFRWIAKTVATTSPYVLQAQDMVPQEIVEELSLLGASSFPLPLPLSPEDMSTCALAPFNQLANNELTLPPHPGQFAETVYACNSAKPFENFLFAHLRELTRPGFPYDCYTALLDSTLVSSFHGTVARLPATIFHHRPTNRLILSISGTSTLQHAYYDVKTLKHRHPSRRGQTHEGFWRLYKGLRARAFDALKDALAKFPDVVELVVTGHSMGGVVSQLLMLDLLADQSVLPDPDIRLKICAFGSPRPGDAALAQYWKELVKTRRLAHGEDSFIEYFVKAFNDGTSCLHACTLRDSSSP